MRVSWKKLEYLNYIKRPSDELQKSARSAISFRNEANIHGKQDPEKGRLQAMDTPYSRADFRSESMIRKIVLADDQAVFRAGLARILAVEDDFRIVGQCDDLNRLYKAAETLCGAIVVFASSLEPALTGLHEKVNSADSRLIAVLEKTEPPFVFLKHNIAGIIYRDVSQAEMIKCVRTVAGGGSYVQQRLATSSVSLNSDVIGARVRDRLSPKELQILGLIIQGYKNKDIAQELNNSEQVIKNYLRSIFDKTGVSDRLELALFAIHHRILSESADETLAIARPMFTTSQTAHA